MQTPPRESIIAARLRNRITLVLALVILAFSAYGFIGKLIEFFHVLGGDDATLFVVTPILNYLLASVGFLLMLGWAVANGMFHDIERPKHRLLDDEELLDRDEPHQPESWIAN